MTGDKGPVGDKGPTGDSGIASMDYYENYLDAAVTMPTSGSWYAGPSVTLPAGTYLITALVTFRRSATTATTWFSRISDGTNHYASGQAYTPSVSGSCITITLSAIVTLTATKTIMIQSTTSAGAAACSMINALASYSVGNNATKISAIKIR